MSYISNFLGGIKRRPSGVLFVQSNTGSLSNSTTETALTTTGVGTLTLPANFFLAGRALRIKAMGYHSSTGNPTITIRIKFGSTAILTMTGSSGNGTNKTFVVDAVLTCRTVGSSGLIWGQGTYFEMHSNGLTLGSDKTSATTFNTTVSQTVSMTAQWGTANSGNNIHLTEFILEAIV